jgi:hypothetical protein
MSDGIEETVRVGYEFKDRRGIAKYVIGIPQGIVNGKYNFLDACIVAKTELPSKKSLVDGLKELYSTSKKDKKQISTEWIMSEPIRFTVKVK